MELPRINLHAHTTYSDGKNSIEDMVNKALESGINYLAITDHLTNSWKSELMTPLNSREKIEDYIKEISECQEFLIANNKNLRLFKGIEVDLGSSVSYIRRLINPIEYEIILFEYLETPEGIAFVRNLIDQWINSVSSLKDFPLIGLAHFDPSYFIYDGLYVLIQFLKDYNIFFEFNSSYPQYYSWRNEIFFKKIKEHQILVSIGSDAHSSKDLNNIIEVFEMIKVYNLESNLERFISYLKKR